MPLIDLCIDARMAFSGGIGTCIRQLVPLLNQSPFRVILLVSQKDQSWCQGLEQVYFPAPIYSVQEQFYFPLKIPRCDIFWSPHYNVPLLPIRAKKRIATIHDACHLALGKSLSFAERCYAKFVMKQALYRSHAVATDSYFSKQELLRLVDASAHSISVIPPAVDATLFSRTKDSLCLNSVRRKYALPKKFLLFVGNQKPHKNLSGLLSAFSRLRDPEIHLVIVGKAKGLKNSVETVFQPRVLYLNNVVDEDLPPLYTLAEIFVFPSFYEGFGLPPLEAMRCGCPCIVSNRASLPEVCGEACFYIDPDHPEELTSAIERILYSEELKADFIDKGYRQTTQLSWKKTAAAYAKLFEITS